VVVVGIEPNWTSRVVDGIAKTGKLHGFSIKGSGDLKIIHSAARVAKTYLQDASERVQEPVEISDTMLSMKDGESDTRTGLGSNRVTAHLVERWWRSAGP